MTASALPLELELAAAGVLHDLRGLIGISKGLALCAVRLIETGRAQEAIAMLQRIDRTAEKGTELCGDVLECTRRNAGGNTVLLRQEDVDLVALAREQVSLHSVFLGEHDATVAFYASAEGTHHVRSHRRSLERVVSNLLQNAARYGHGHPIDLHVSGNFRGTVLIVRDRGRGIPSEALSRIFAPYESKSDSDICFERFGLGLWIVRNLVSSLGGTIHVVSEVDLGTAVTVSLPAAGNRA